jgi:type IV pilus assembly protein PilE
MNKGFTLIELLVVVLIIGILAAVALPQYTKAVEKSRATEAIAFMGDLATAERIHQMATGDFIDGSLSTAVNPVLDIELPTTFKSFDTVVITKSTDLYASMKRANGAATYYINMYLPKEPGAPVIWCALTAAGTTKPTAVANLAATTADNMCKSIANGNAKGLISGTFPAA